MSRQLRTFRALVAYSLLIFSGFASGAMRSHADTPLLERGDAQAFHDTANFSADPNAGSAFGSAVAATDQYLVIGMESSLGRSGPAQAAFVYDAVNGNLLHTLTGNVNTEGNGSRFGSSIAVEGNLAVIGAEFEHVDAPGGGTRFNSGAAYVFDLTTGAQIARLVPDLPFGNSFFGSGVAIHGDKVVVGSWGSAYLFDAFSGQQLAEFIPTERTSQFGVSVALNESVAVIGANSDESRGQFTGAAFVFDLATHNQLRKIIPDDALGSSGTGGGDNFGISVELDGNNAIIGSPLHSHLIGNRGAAYVYDVTNGNQLAKLLPPLPGTANPEFLGYDVDIQGNLAVVGAVQDHRRGEVAGAAFLYDWTSGQPLAEFVASGINAHDQFSYSVSFGDGKAYATTPSKELRGGVYAFNLIPEPTSMLSLAIGLIGTAASRWKPRRTC
jgi:hypothetical protein